MKHETKAFTVSEQDLLAVDGSNRSTAYRPVSVVVIGRNEAKNLPLCIQSIREMNYPQVQVEILYVDTDSSDGSPDVARSLGAMVFEEHSDFPSPGRARNRGWQEAKHDIVHFIDGDMSIGCDYLSHAVPCLVNDQAACVFGCIDERNKSRNLFSRIMHYNWENKSPGYLDAPGAGGTFLRSALIQVDGYNPDLLQGEETDIGRRLRPMGHRILMIDQLMGIHDYDVQTLGSVARRFYNGTGRYYGRLLLMPRSERIAPEQRAAFRSLIQCLGALALTVTTLIAGWWIAIALLPLLLPLYITVKYWQPARLRRLRIEYFLMTYSVKPLIWAGMLGFLWNNWRQRSAHGRTMGTRMPQAGDP